jgi:hypothetical protein
MMNATIAFAGPADRPTGYALYRRFGRGMLIGPVIAEDEAAAIDLAEALARPGFVRMDVAAEATRVVAWLEAAGMRCVSEARIMTRGGWAEAAGPARLMALAGPPIG